MRKGGCRESERRPPEHLPRHVAFPQRYDERQESQRAENILREAPPTRSLPHVSVEPT